MATAYLGLGANLGNRRKQLIAAAALLAERAGDIPALSGFYETAPWGYDSPHPFLNAALQLETGLSPAELLAVTQQIERELGRSSKTGGTAAYRDRPVDIDLLLYDRLVLEQPGLVLPHPLMHKRLFVLQPLAEIAPSLQHPALRQTIAALLEQAKKRRHPPGDALPSIQ
ncbi:MAG: 2-amino-4-hydroxy-6-hydroxymethyldihydropteridine diphosphokinase [Tannerella sp.]|jgi:2-amino-4-hydroxy-6-hydroxymethyldihydropteridine diphosphokinase|nr:2-amino-4-hydroxy-6-hydroxymethyldihydropteridine diphosphokinase [Tannerella sp.]